MKYKVTQKKVNFQNLTVTRITVKGEVQCIGGAYDQKYWTIKSIPGDIFSIHGEEYVLELYQGEYVLMYRHFIAHQLLKVG